MNKDIRHQWVIPPLETTIIEVIDEIDIESLQTKSDETLGKLFRKIITNGYQIDFDYSKMQMEIYKELEDNE